MGTRDRSVGDAVAVDPARRAHVRSSPSDAVELCIAELAAAPSAVFGFLGGAGEGKTWTLRQVVEHAKGAGLAVTERSARGIQIQVPASPDSRAADDDAIHALLRAVGLSLDSRALLVIDDLHDASCEVLDAVSRLCRSPHRGGLSIVAAFRAQPGDAEREWTALARRGRATLVRLGPVERGVASRMLDEQLGESAPARVAQWLHQSSHGNPLLISQSARALGRYDSVPTAPAELVDVISRGIGSTTHLLRLDAKQRACLEAASILGPRFRANVALDVADLGADGHAAMDGLWREGLFSDGPGRTVAFKHRLVQRTVYAQLTPPERSRLHARAFAVLARSGFERRAAQHAILADLAGNDDAITLLSRVGRSALKSGDAAGAARRFRDAIELAHDRATPELYIGFAEALMCSGSPRVAARSLERLLGELELGPAMRLEAVRMLAACLDAVGERRAASHELELGAELARSTDPSAEAAIVLERALLSIRIGDFATARLLVDRAGSLDQKDVHRQQVAVADAVLRALQGDATAVTEIEATATETLYRALSLSEGRTRLTALSMLCGVVLSSRGHHKSATAFIVSALRALRHQVPNGGLASLHASEAYVYLRSGRVDRADKASAAAVAAAADAPGELPLALTIRARVLFHMARADEAVRCCDAASGALADAEDAIASMWLHGARGALDVTAGRLADAAEHFCTAASMSSDMGCLVPDLASWDILGITALVRGSAASADAALLAQLEQDVARADAPARMRTAVARSLMAEREGDVEAALTLMNEAVAEATDNAAALDRLSIAWLLGGLLRRQGKTRESHRVCLDALREAKSRGALALALLIERDLTVAGSSRGRRRTPPGELTAAERRVAELAALGRSNREIAGQLWISVNTVETHLQRAYLKLGVTAREQLAQTAELAG